MKANAGQRIRAQGYLGLGRNNGLLFWSNVCYGAGFNLLLVLLSLYFERLGAEPAEIGLALGATAVARTVLSVPAGAIADRVAAKPVIVITLALAVPGALVLAFAGHWQMALLGALLVELASVGSPSMSVYIGAATTAEERTHAYTYIYTIAFSAGGIIAPLGGGWLADVAGFRAAYLISAVAFLASTLIATRIDSLAVRAPCDADADADAPAVGYRQLLHMPGPMTAAGMHLAVPFVLSIGVALLANYLVDDGGLRLGMIGTLGSVASLAALPLSFGIAHSRRMPGPFAGIGICVALTAAGFALLLASNALGIVFIAYVLRAGYKVVWPLMTAAVADVTPELLRGRAYGLAELGAGIGDIAAPVAAGLLYGVDHRLPLAAGALAALPLIAAAFVAHHFREALATSDIEALELADAPGGPS